MTILGERFGAQLIASCLRSARHDCRCGGAVPVCLSACTERTTTARCSSRGRAGLLALLQRTAATASALLAKLGVPNAWMLGPLAVAVAPTLAEVGLSVVPVWLSNSAQLLLGCALGSGFDRKSLSTAPRFVAMVCASVILAILVSALFAWGLALAGAVPISTMVLATAPGGMAEMCVTAKVLQLGVPLVTAAHVTRVIILVSITGPMFRLAKYLRRSWRA